MAEVEFGFESSVPGGIPRKAKPPVGMVETDISGECVLSTSTDGCRREVCLQRIHVPGLLNAANLEYNEHPSLVIGP